MIRIYNDVFNLTHRSNLCKGFLGQVYFYLLQKAWAKVEAVNINKSFSTAQKISNRCRGKLKELVGNKIVEKITKATSKRTQEDPNKLKAPAQTDETSKQLIEIPKEKYIPQQK